METQTKNGTRQTQEELFQKLMQDECPVYTSRLWSVITFHWLTSFMWRMFKRGHGSFEELWTIPARDSASVNGSRYEMLWRSEVSKHGMKEASLWRTTFLFIRRWWILATILTAFHVIVALCIPMLVFRYIMLYVESESSSLGYGLGLATLLLFGELVRLITFANVWFMGTFIAVRTRGGISSLLFQKILRIKSLRNTSMGKIVNLFSNDCQRVFEACLYSVHIIASALTALLSVIYCIIILGPWALLGALVVFSVFPFQTFMSRLNTYYKKKSLHFTDKRVQLLSEILNSIKLIKLYAWENSFSSTINALRRSESGILLKAALVTALSSGVTPLVSVFATIATFVGHTMSGNSLTVVQAFVVLSVYNQIQLKMGMIPMIVKSFSESNISFGRVKAVLALEESYRDLCNQPSSSGLAVEILNCTLAWENTEESSSSHHVKHIEKRKQDLIETNLSDKALNMDELKKKTNDKCVIMPLQENETIHDQNEHDFTEVIWDIEFSVKKGMLCGICGSVGSGKSSLIAGILGQMEVVKGKVAINGTISYVPQQSWIQNATLRENILFGQPFNNDRYNTVLNQCCLMADLDMLPAGDNTEIGERGINLSGGQKQRISLARAVYSDKDIYLLDDPLSAVDSHVGQHLFEHCLRGALAGKTVVFVTHQLQYLRQCDHIVVFSGGRIQEQGSHSQLVATDGAYANLIHTFHQYSTADEGEETNTSKISCGVENNQKTGTSAKDGADTGKILTEEMKAKGSIAWSVYSVYLHAAGGVLPSILAMLLLLIPILISAGSNWWLSFWLINSQQKMMNATYLNGNATVDTESVNISEDPHLNFYVMVYGLFGLAILITSGVGAFCFTKLSLHAASHLHQKLFVKVISAPMSFFDTTPAGRSINRFSRDIDEVDVKLPFRGEAFLRSFYTVIVCVGVVLVIFPWIILALLPMCICFFLLNHMCRVVLRETKRADGMSRSPLYSHVASTLHGLPTIHAYKKQDRFLLRFQELLDKNSMSLFLFYCSSRWLSLRFDILTSLVTFLTAVMVVVIKGAIPPALSALALIYAHKLTGRVQFCMRSAAEAEAHFTAVERIVEYSKNICTEESDYDVVKQIPPDTWPAKGNICMDGYSMRYRPGLPLVLSEVSFAVEPHQKVGIIGRTGAGKSSLVLALFRFMEPANGTIYIDGIDISTVPLQTLRSRLSVIPQDPVLFAGSLRYNLDPFDKHSDSSLWSALEQCFLKDLVIQLDEGLQCSVIENGDNFSVGERQLICMARALLRHSKIILLDEATAAIDTETDTKIQKTIQETFKECTTLTIAHRLHTVLHCDQVLVMDQGKVVEDGRPENLLADSTSHFYSLVQASEISLTNAQRVIDIARQTSKAEDELCDSNTIVNLRTKNTVQNNAQIPVLRNSDFINVCDSNADAIYEDDCGTLEVLDSPWHDPSSDIAAVGMYYQLDRNRATLKQTRSRLRESLKKPAALSALSSDTCNM